MSGVNPSPYISKVSACNHRLWLNRAPLLGKLDIEITERCNNNCIHCSINLPADDGARQRELTTGELKDILTEAVALGALSVRFTGGEPLLRHDFQELYVFARKLGFRVLIFTNARLITKDLVALFKRIPPLVKLEVTVYGMSQKTYEAVTRVPGSYGEFRRGVALLQQNNIPFIVKGVLLPQNEDEVEPFEAWAATLPWMDSPPGYTLLLDQRARRDFAEKNQLIKSLRAAPAGVVNFFRRRGESYLKDMQVFCSKFMGPPGELLFTCGSGKIPCVDAYGALQPCLLLRHPDTVYDLKRGSLKDALKNYFPRLREIRAANSDYLARCARCFLKSLCEQCPARSWSEHGTLDTPVEYLCQVAHAEAFNLGLLREGEHGWEVKSWRERVAWI
jgi:radical SAM protein with 4Fe4S-binding SPASM domain